MAAAHLLLLKYFGKERDAIFVSTEATDTVSDVLQRELPNTLCLIALGDFLLTSQRFMLSVEQNIVCQDICSVNSGLAMMFASYYVFNLMYPEVVGTEFIQRCFVCINPENGTKVARGKRSRPIPEY